MRTVLISIQPKWCKLILSGDKTLEIRKNKPKLITPFKCYIYCTQAKTFTEYLWTSKSAIFGIKTDISNGKIIGEFICDKIIQEVPRNRTPQSEYPEYCELLSGSCLTNDDLIRYGKCYSLNGWYISELKIYDRPKELQEFNLKRPPQSWCYVNEI